MVAGCHFLRRVVRPCRLWLALRRGVTGKQSDQDRADVVLFTSAQQLEHLLEEGPELYKTFRAKKDGCIKVIMKP